ISTRGLPSVTEILAWPDSRGTVRGTSSGKTRVHSVLSGRTRDQSVQAVRPGLPSGPLLIRGFGVRVPGGAPGGLHVSVRPIFTFASDILVCRLAWQGVPLCCRPLRVLAVTLRAARLVRVQAGVAAVAGPGALGGCRACCRRPVLGAPRCLWRRGGELA